MSKGSDKLIERLKFNQERYSLIGPKPQNLSYLEIVDRVADFMLNNENLRVGFAFSNEVGEELEDPNDARFDPIAFLEKYPDRFDEIMMSVNQDVLDLEHELLSRKDKSLYAYNTLAVGAAIKLASSQDLSPGLTEFIVEHLISPKPPSESKSRGRPKNTNDDLFFKLEPIKLAVMHGLKPTRNDESHSKNSACDAVADAAQKLYQATGNTTFISGYTFEALKKVWRSNLIK